jgi:DNA-binding NarL/FixJ family response regulator
LRSIRVLIVDDQKLFATSLQGILTDLGRGVLGEISIAYNGEAALKELNDIQPDVILLDIFMPGMTGLEALRIMKQKLPKVKVLMLTAFGYDNYVREAMANGACGFLLKDSTPKEVLETIMAAGAGKILLSKSVVDAIVGKAKVFNRRKSVVPEWLSLLSDKERRILLYISKGFSNDEIADRLNLGKNTVRNYVSSIYEKINVKDRFEAIRLAVEAQIHTLVLE